MLRPYKCAFDASKSSNQQTSQPDDAFSMLKMLNMLFKHSLPFVVELEHRLQRSLLRGKVYHRTPEIPIEKIVIPAALNEISTFFYCRHVDECYCIINAKCSWLFRPGNDVICMPSKSASRRGSRFS